jgi:DNA polymerase beta
MAYSKAIKTIEKLEFKINFIKQVKNLKGIGTSILEKIQEFLLTGKINKVEEVKPLLNIKSDKDEIIELFINIWGVGNVKANDLYNKGYKTLEDIKKNINILNRQQQIGFKYYEDFLKKIPRLNITIIQTIIRYILNNSFGKNTYKLQVAGSYRRGKAFSNDIDILISSKYFTLKEIVEVLIKHNIISDVLSMQNEKFMGVAHCPRSDEPYFRLDIEFLPEEEFAYGLLYFTGSKDFNKEIRQHAKNMGYTLNQHGLKDKNGDYIKAKNEEDIFKILDLQYLEPKKR